MSAEYRSVACTFGLRSCSVVAYGAHDERDRSDEIASQPGAGERAARPWKARATTCPRLPAHGERVAAVGCGTSWFMAQSYAALREDAGVGETDAFAASEFPADRAYDRVVAISRSGTTTEVASAARAVDGRLPTTAITAVAGSPIAGPRHRDRDPGLRRRTVRGADPVRDVRAGVPACLTWARTSTAAIADGDAVARRRPAGRRHRVRPLRVPGARVDRRDSPARPP